MKNYTTEKENNSLSNKHQIKQGIINSSIKTLKSFKPSKYNLPIDLNVLKIFSEMKKEIKQSFYLSKKKIELKNSDLIIRKDLIYQMKHFINKYRLNPNTLYFSVYIMDKLLSNQINLNLEKIAFVSLLLSVKFNDIDGQIPPLKYFEKEMISSYNLSKKELINIEVECLNILNHNLTQSQPLFFINIFLLNGIIFNNELNLNSYDDKNKMFYASIYLKPIEIYEEIILLSPDYFQYNPIYLACACIAISRELYSLNTWNFILENFSGIFFKDFKDVYIFVKTKHKEYRSEMNKKKMYELEKEKEKEINVININKEINSIKEKTPYNHYTDSLIHKRILTMNNNNNIINSTNIPNNIINNIIYKYSIKNAQIKNSAHSYNYKPYSFDMNSENRNSQLLKTKNLEKELNESNSSTEASANNTTRDIYNNNKLLLSYKKILDSSKKIKNDITFSNYYKTKYNSENKLVNKKTFYNEISYQNRLNQLIDSKKTLFINKSKMNFVKMGSFSYSKNNLNKINLINESYSSNIIPHSISSYNSQEKNYKKYGMNAVSTFQLKNYQYLKTLNNKSTSSIDSKKNFGNNRYNFLIGNNILNL